MSRIKNYRWIYHEYNVSSSETIQLSVQSGLSLVTSAIALNRDINTPDILNEFITKSIDKLNNPFLMKDMDKAVARIEKAISQKENIVIYGDYDVDGITSTSILTSYLKGLGACVSFYIPIRMDEGYGLNLASLDTIHKQGANLIITVDTGITAVSEAEIAASLGIDLIITDHHQCKDELPICCAIINPIQPNCNYPFKSLCGVGVVFKLLVALEKGSHEKILNRYGDLVALGTIADIVSLKGENHIISAYGLKQMSKTSNVGLKALIDVCELNKKPITITNVGYTLAPRINAAGRIGNSELAVGLFLSQDENEATDIAIKLTQQNKDRQNTEGLILKEVLEKISSDPSYKEKKVLVIWGEGWHNGVIGIVASKICDKYSKPCILISCEDGIGKGSGRSVKGFNLFLALNECASLCEKFGGHELAAGLTINMDNIEKLDEMINIYAGVNLDSDALIPSIYVDFELPSDYINISTAQELFLLEPFGTNNPIPYFSISECEILSRILLSDNKHIKFTLLKDQKRFDAIGFNMGYYSDYILSDDTIDILGILSINEYKNKKQIQIILKDMKVSKQPEPSSVVPERNDLNTLYIYIKKNSKDSVLKDHMCTLVRKISRTTGITFNEKKLTNCLLIFAEQFLATFAIADGDVDIYLKNSNGRKFDLTNSKTIQLLSNE